MSSSLTRLQELQAALAVDYAAQIANTQIRPGAVTAAIMPASGVYQFAGCDTSPLDLTCDIVLLAASTGPQGSVDLIGHVDTVAGLARGVGWVPTEWRPSSVDDTPALTLTVTAVAEG